MGLQVLSKDPNIPTVLAGDFNINIRSNEEEFVLKLIPGYEVIDGNRLFRMPGVGNDFVLRDAYGDINAQETASTSFNATRNHCIDYLFYTPEYLKVRWRSPLKCTQEPMPNLEEPSDHIALCVEFEWNNKMTTPSLPSNSPRL